MKVYVDDIDMLVKSLIKQSHVDDSNESLEILKKHNMKLKLANVRAFDVSSDRSL